MLHEVLLEVITDDRRGDFSHLIVSELIFDLAFVLQITDDGQIYSQAHQRRFEDMLVKRERRREINRQNGAKGGNPNFQKGKPNPYYIGIEDNQSVIPDKQKISKDNSKLEENKREEKRTEENRKEQKKSC